MTHIARCGVAFGASEGWIALHVALNGSISLQQGLLYIGAFIAAVYLAKVI